MRTGELTYGYSYDRGGGESKIPVNVHHSEGGWADVELRESSMADGLTDPWMRGAGKGTVLHVPLTAVRFTD